MGAANTVWGIARALALAVLAGIFAGVGTAFAIYSGSRIFSGRSQPDSMDPLGFVFGAIGWLLAWGVWRLARGRPGARLVKWILIAIALGEPILFAIFDSLSGIMMHT
jgi:hypothetical protein